MHRWCSKKCCAKNKCLVLVAKTSTCKVLSNVLNMQRIAAICSICCTRCMGKIWLQHSAAYCNIVQHIAAHATYCSIYEHITPYCSICSICHILQHVQHIATYAAVCCNMHHMHHIAVCYIILQHIATYDADCSTLQQTGQDCNICSRAQHDASYSNIAAHALYCPTLQHIAICSI